mgnify:FL=1
MPLSISSKVFLKALLIIFILVLLACDIFFGFEYFSLQKDLSRAKADLGTQKTNEKIVDFTKLFISDVLKAEKEVDFETRLKLETAVRNLNDEEILNQWQKFIDSKTELEAQKEVKNLLEILVNKIRT